MDNVNFKFSKSIYFGKRANKGKINKRKHRQQRNNDLKLTDLPFQLRIKALKSNQN